MGIFTVIPPEKTTFSAEISAFFLYKGLVYTYYTFFVYPYITQRFFPSQASSRAREHIYYRSISSVKNGQRTFVIRFFVFIPHRDRSHSSLVGARKAPFSPKTDFLRQQSAVQRRCMASLCGRGEGCSDETYSPQEICFSRTPIRKSHADAKKRITSIRYPFFIVPYRDRRVVQRQALSSLFR